MTDNEPTLVTLVEELAASKEPITAVGIVGLVTLRQAIASVFWKSASLLRLTDRPVAPNKADDQFGHVLSMRTEVLINQAILQAIVTKLNDAWPHANQIDIAAIRTNVIRSLS